MKSRIIFALLLAIAPATGCNKHSPDLAWKSPESKAYSNPGLSIALVPRSSTFDLSQVPQGAVGFTASIRNEGKTIITIAHPTICEPANSQGKERHINEFHGKSEILLKIKKPDGTSVILRDGYMHPFDPDLHPLRTIPPKGTGIFDVGWFFQNQRGRWEQDDLAAKVFLSKGKYGIRILFRNFLPKARLYDEKTGKVSIIDVWTGEMESGEITIEVK